MMMESLQKAAQDTMQFWIESHWFVALLISTLANVGIYLGAAWLLSSLIERLIKKHPQFSHIDARPLHSDQVRREITFGVMACAVFAAVSLLSRAMFVTLWPESWLDFLLQIGAFLLFYEVYSYAVHRLLHSRWLRKQHAVHHRSVRVTPWSAYSVHPVEALCFSLTVPMFMWLWPFSLSVALLLHMGGMVFTILLHANVCYHGQQAILNFLFSHPRYHARHHAESRFHFGFLNSWCDRAFNTIKQTE